MTNKIKALLNPGLAVAGAIIRVGKQLERAEHEQPRLAAADGTIAVQIDDLRTLMDRLDQMRDMLALAPQVWRPRWYGSEPQRGSSIIDDSGNTVVYFGGDEHTHALVTQICVLHNAALVALGGDK